jgi:hypothetical protein
MYREDFDKKTLIFFVIVAFNITFLFALILTVGSFFLSEFQVEVSDFLYNLYNAISPEADLSLQKTIH